MSKRKSCGAAQAAARMFSPPSSSRSRAAAGPTSEKPSPGTTPKPPPGHTIKKEGGVITFRRTDIGEGAVECPNSVSCHEHRLRHHDVPIETTSDHVGNTTSRSTRHRPLVLPMRVTPHAWRPRG